MRIITALLIAVSALITSGCTRSGENHSYSYHKASISQSQLLADEANLRKTSGVVRVIPNHLQDGSATIEVEVTDKEHIAIQKKLSDMGYVKGLH
jgi:hypothetical protein